MIFIHVFGDRAIAAQTAAGWETYLSRLEPHLAGGYLSEAEAHGSWDQWGKFTRATPSASASTRRRDGNSWRLSGPVNDIR